MVVFVILHYSNFEDTIECISSIKKIQGEKKIVVVDNNSLDATEVSYLRKQVDDLLLLKENLGFAKANNKGVDLAKKKYNPLLVVVLNNDCLVKQHEFLKLIKEDYKKYNFDLLGTKIITEGDSVNPYLPLRTKNDVEKEIKYVKKLVYIYNNSLLFLLLKFYLKIKHLFIKPLKPQNGDGLEKGVALHGCGIVFSQKYLEKYNYIFYNNTFLFHEEDFLYQRIKKDNLISIYDPNIELIHKEGASMKKSIKNERQKKLFREKERLKSLELLLKDM